jgi:hypothetical protein
MSPLQPDSAAPDSAAIEVPKEKTATAPDSAFRRINRRIFI